MARGEKQLLTINSWYTNFCISTQWASQYMPPCRVNERSFYSKAERRSYVALGIIIPSMIHFHHINRKHTEHKTTTTKKKQIKYHLKNDVAMHHHHHRHHHQCIAAIFMPFYLYIKCNITVINFQFHLIDEAKNVNMVSPYRYLCSACELRAHLHFVSTWKSAGELKEKNTKKKLLPVAIYYYCAVYPLSNVHTHIQVHWLSSSNSA